MKRPLCWLLASTFVLCYYTAYADNRANFAAINYARLKAELPYYQEAAAHPEKYPWPTIPATRHLLHLGSNSDAVLLLRQRLKTSHDLDERFIDTKTMDKGLVDAVKVFQWRHGLEADGVVGEATRRELNVSPAVRARQIALNMDRWAQLSNQMGTRFILVNIPEYQLHVIDDDEEKLSMKVVVGRPTRPTPELTSDITRITFNPYWNVPQKIANKDIVPKVIKDNHYLATNGIRIFSSQENDAYEIPPNEVNWFDAESNGFPYHLRQEPGIKNALGLVKFEFQNSHDVYLHDTPAKDLFAKDTRDFSSGCIRLEKPFALVAYLTQHDGRMSSSVLHNTLLSKKIHYFRIHQDMPIAIAYLTSWVDARGVVHFVTDVYHRDEPGATVTPVSQGGADDDGDDKN